MASMELTPEQQQEGMAPMAYTPCYAVGEIYLRQEALEALGITGAIAPGTVVRFSGTAKVVSASMRDDMGEEESCLSIQPTDLELAVPKNAQAMFPNSEMEE